MSYIHDALKKAQKEKGAHSRKYQGLAPAGVPRPNLLPGKALWAAPVLLGCVVVAAYLWLAPSDKGTATPEALRTPVPAGAPAPLAGEPAPGPRVVTGPQHQATPEPGVARTPETAMRRDTAPVPEASGKDGTGPVPREPGKQESEPGKRPDPRAAPELSGSLNAAALYEKAGSFQRSGQWQQARAMYERALGQDPGHVGALNNMGVLYIRDQNYPAARKAFSEAIRLEPGYVDAYYNLSCVYALEGRLSESLVHLNKAASLDPSVKDWARQDSDLANLHGLPDFEEMTAGAGVVE